MVCRQATHRKCMIDSDWELNEARVGYAPADVLR